MPISYSCHFQSKKSNSESSVPCWMCLCSQPRGAYAQSVWSVFHVLHTTAATCLEGLLYLCCQTRPRKYLPSCPLPRSQPLQIGISFMHILSPLGKPPRAVQKPLWWYQTCKLPTETDMQWLCVLSIYFCFSNCKIRSQHFVLLDVRQAVTQAQKNF